MRLEGEKWQNYSTPFVDNIKKDNKENGTEILSITPASAKEKQELFDKLAEAGKKWNPETKQLEDIQWRAKKEINILL